MNAARHRGPRWDSALATRLGVVGALALYAAMVLLWTFAPPPFLEADEDAHVDYGIELTHGRIPLAGPAFEPEFPRLGQHGASQHVSNHPPLYYALTGPIERLGLETGHGRTCLFAVRLINGLLGGLVVVMIAKLASMAVAAAAPHRRAFVTIAAASVSAPVPALVAAGATIMNDLLEVTLATLTVLVLMRALRHRLTLSTVAPLAVLCSLGMLTRISFAPLWLLGVGGTFVLALWPGMRRGWPPRRRWLRATCLAAPVVVVPLLASGWFYALSVHRYGDLTGGGAVYKVVSYRELSDAASHGPVVYMLHPLTWWRLVRQVAGADSPAAGDTTSLLLVGVMAAGLVTTGVRLAATHMRVVRRTVDRVGLWLLLTLFLVALSAYVSLADHVMHKGVGAIRYLLNGLPLWGVGVSLVLVSLGRLLSPYAVMTLVATMSVGDLVRLSGLLERRAHRPEGTWFETVVGGMRMSGIPAADILTAGLLVLAAVGLTLQSATLILTSRGHPRPDAPTTASAPSTSLTRAGAHR